MTQGTPIERVTAVLTKSGYRSLSMPLNIASIPFEFAAALLGPDRAPDLVIVVDTIDEREGRVCQKITAFSRALDIIGSRRPLTAILAGPRPHTSTIEALGRVCRVLPVGTPIGDTADAMLHDSLAVLLPLQLPEPSDSVADSIGELMRQLPSDIDLTVKDAIILRASQGIDAVRDGLRAVLTECLPEDLREHQ